MLKVFICGGSGYTGGELLRILSNHTGVKVIGATSEKSAGKSPAELFPNLKKYSNLIYEPLKPGKILNKAELFFMSLPHGKSQEAVDFFFKHGKKVIDLSADYRLRDVKIYEEWYKVPHNYQSTLKKAVYGLPELYRKKIARASLTANPGCYPTGAILGLYPAIKNKFIDYSSIIIDSKSGVSGAGRNPDIRFAYCEINEGFKAYAITTHRHTPEIEQELSLSAGIDIKVNFTPHLAPFDRGILTTIYAPLTRQMGTTEIIDLYKDIYTKEPFVIVHDEGKLPDVKSVRGTNLCEIATVVNKRTNTLVVVTAIDNLVKGASGQAVHNMNIMMGFDEKTALDTLAIFP
ncbi:MAG: N-acetyl-gamma-glutamyl-phosphate reductase [Nitrospirae bacterium]|jgi:N-acetyl-gamma-glutamyl-phosphate reductase|nr:N-acetyl-gamma-glutamyl-phosphate reductase [Nitrospirota bacterium]